MGKIEIKPFRCLPSITIKLIAFCCIILIPPVSHSAENDNHIAPLPYILEALEHHDLVLLGTTHLRPPILKFINSLLPHLKDAGVTHIGLEIPADQQGNIDNFINTGNGLTDIYVHPQIECPEYRGLLKTLHGLDKDSRLSVVAIDLSKKMYKKEISRDEWMARTITEAITRNPDAKFLVVLGNFHALKKIEWQEHVPGKTGSIREYLSKLVPDLNAFSIGQIIDDDPSECDFSKRFGPLEGAVAIDCDFESFKGWKLGLTSAIAIKKTEPCQLFDGFIVY